MPKVMEYETLTPDDVGGRYAVVVKIRPVLPQEEMQRVQMAQAFRSPGTDGRPLMDDQTIIEDILEKSNPDAIARRIDAQQLPAQSKDVADYLKAARERDWMKDNPTIIKAAEEQLGKKIELWPQELQAIVEILVKQRMGAQGGPQLLAQADTMAAGGQPMGAPGQGPVGMDPAALPSQMQLGAEPGTQVDPQMLAASQAQRGRAQQPY